jgi:phosphatidylserine/phosphatidylglycerophosphate/cardiolipin synthase-like enzyme
MGLNEEGPGKGVIFFVIVVILGLLLIGYVRVDQSGMPSVGSDSNFSFNNLGIGIDTNNFVLPEQKLFAVQKVEAYFCPQDDCSDKLIKKIDYSSKTLYIAIYSFTHDGISDAVLRAKKRGVDVRVIFDYDQSKNQSSDDEKLIEAGVVVARKNGSGYMHNKFTIIDGNLVATGSFNYSQNADTKNDENLIFIASEEVAQQFKTDFDKIFVSAERA